MGPVSPICSTAQRRTLTRSSGVQNQSISPSNSPHGLNSSSISRPRKPLASRFHRLSWFERIRRSDDSIMQIKFATISQSLFRKYLMLLVTLLSVVLIATAAINIYSSFRANKEALLGLQINEALSASEKIG